jgi:hypothetical protein
MILSGAKLPDPGKSVEMKHRGSTKSSLNAGPNDLAAGLNDEAAAGAGEKRFWMPEKAFG